MPAIKIADKPTLDWIKNKFYTTDQVEINLEDLGDIVYSNTISGDVGRSSTSPTTITGKGVITITGANQNVYFRVDGGTQSTTYLGLYASFQLYFNTTVTVYSDTARYVAQTV